VAWKQRGIEELGGKGKGVKDREAVGDASSAKTGKDEVVKMTLLPPPPHAEGEGDGFRTPPATRIQTTKHPMAKAPSSLK